MPYSLISDKFHTSNFETWRGIWYDNMALDSGIAKGALANLQIVSWCKKLAMPLARDYSHVTIIRMLFSTPKYWLSSVFIVIQQWYRLSCSFVFCSHVFVIKCETIMFGDMICLCVLALCCLHIPTLCVTLRRTKTLVGVNPRNQVQIMCNKHFPLEHALMSLSFSRCETKSLKSAHDWVGFTFQTAQSLPSVT